jgi:Spy/CpxP family protein refolding chaperone
MLMTTMRRATAVVCGLTIVLATSLLAARAQEPKGDQPGAGSASPSAKRTYDPSRRVPDHFGQIGLSAQQRESIYKIREKHQPKIDALERQLREVRAQVLAECEGILTVSQKQILEQRRQAAGEARKSRATARTEAKSAKAAD